MNQLINYSYKRDKKHLTFKGEDGQIYTIGSKLFPLSKKKNIGVWWSANTKEVERNKTLVMAMNSITNYEFKVGMCYTNAQVLQQLGEQFNLNIKYYSGWVFPVQSMPIHHAWVVLDDKIIIDPSIHSSYINANLRMIENVELFEGKTKDEVREIYVDFIAEEKKKTKDKVSLDCLWGKVPFGYMYFGTEDTYGEAKKRFNELIDSVEVHPSYTYRMDEKTGASPTQELLKEKGIW